MISDAFVHLSQLKQYPYSQCSDLNTEKTFIRNKKIEKKVEK